MAAHASFLLSLATAQSKLAASSSPRKQRIPVLRKPRLLPNENQLMLKRRIWYFWPKYLLNAYMAGGCRGLGEIQKVSRENLPELLLCSSRELNRTLNTPKERWENNDIPGK